MFKEIELQDKEIFKKYLQGCEIKTDMANFTSLFLWKDWCGHTTWDIINDTIVVQKTFGDELFHFCPLSADKEKIVETIKILIAQAIEENKNLKFTEINDTQRDFILKACPTCFNVKENRDGADYIYSVKDLIDLPGRAYSSKRNHINKFLRTYTDYEFKELGDKEIPDCLNYIQTWAQNHYNNEDVHFQGEYQGTLLALKHFNELDVKGLGLYVDGKMEGFTIGEELNPNTALIHIEKASSHIDGAYTILNREFLARCWNNYQFVNREEDMGMPGLRKAKESYHPVKLEMTYILELKR